MDGKLHAHRVAFLAPLTAISLLALVGSQAQADVLVSRFPESTLNPQQQFRPEFKVGCPSVPFGQQVMTTRQVARPEQISDHACSQAIMQSFLKHVGPAGLVMTFVPLDNAGGSSSSGGSNNPPPPPPPVVSSSGGGPSGGVSSAPEPGTLIAGVVGAGLVVLMVVAQQKRKAAISLRA
jgi:hypothetical protein